MPVSMPMWPSYFAVLTRPIAAATAAPNQPRRRWVIVDENVRREVDEAEYRASLARCSRIEVASYPDEDVVTNLCYRGRS